MPERVSADECADICKDCGSPFQLDAGEREFFERKGWQLPKRCKTCRLRRKVASEGAR